mgnify:CR=1 FL=1
MKKGKTTKAIKELNEVIKKLEKEIQKNLKTTGNHREEDDDHNEEAEDEKRDEKKVRISTEDAEKLISIVEEIREKMIE